MAIQEHTKLQVTEVLSLLKSKLNDAEVQEKIRTATSYLQPEARLTFLASEISGAIHCVSGEEYHEGEAFHSRHPLAGLCQSHLNHLFNGVHGGAAEDSPVLGSNLEVTHSSFGDALPADTNLMGEGSLLWTPLMINILIEHLRPKADFISATDARSSIEIPEKCVIALLGDWGADNDHAQRIAKRVRDRSPDVAVHLGDIYYSGSEYESARLIENWPKANKNFALNGNHEMYSRGFPYFGTVLRAFGQEASYFTLHNEHWQLHGLDTAYVPFSLDGQVDPNAHPKWWERALDAVASVTPFVDHSTFDRQPDARLQHQWEWLKAKVNVPGKRDIFLSHNQPVSAYLPEFEAGSFLHDQLRKLQGELSGGANIPYAWFFGHEHKCTIYDDRKTDFRARLIGNGAIPHSKQALMDAAKDDTRTSCTPVFTMNDRILRKDAFGIDKLALAISGFALLTLDGPDAWVEYINEDGSLFLHEKLSGGPNEVVEMGAGYRHL